MEDRRQLNRQSPELQLEVFDLHSGQRLGRVVDLSSEGFMLFSDTPLAVDALIECRIVSEQLIEGIGEVQLGADCLWSRPGADSQHCWAGFHIIDIAEDQAALLETLLKHL
ncbi:PilZ domain-containing protein [Pseudomonas sp. M30-35]|uniref:PilZ domain-containing protein n=1 Tax=Pseudomonas sp. M30-35 TaxID=1981174 RepID=UPI000B3C3779|nr:PilZ domain-containing protein [Pseudomonas sp. M30-35]ARU89796.1 pilus assembly protein PilZ [Pseudomonas sp. M30-35]